MGSSTSTKGPRGPAGLSRDQLALIHVARRDRHLAEDEYRTLLQVAAGVGSAKDLTVAGFEQVMAHFKAIGFVHRPRAAFAPAAPKAPTFGARSGMASEAQIDLIRVLWARWHGAPDERALNTWLEGRFGVSSLRFATVHTASIAVEGLKAMNARKATKCITTAAEAAPKE